eukprot:gb/GEZN01014274.1/.p1 GENE.gb/GEZN01014274.1/~~gb/GEZN01014274.1/.p1  ORF type:complete len:298 (-),score=13.67 gb/GEZN01014274.1/:16-909(-)
MPLFAKKPHSRQPSSSSNLRLDAYSDRAEGELQGRPTACCCPNSWCVSRFCGDWQNPADTYTGCLLRMVLVLVLGGILFWCHVMSQGLDWLENSQYRIDLSTLPWLSIFFALLIQLGTATLIVVYGRWQKRIYHPAVQFILFAPYVTYMLYVFGSYWDHGEFPSLPIHTFTKTSEVLDIWFIGKILLGPFLALFLPLFWTALVLLSNQVLLVVQAGLSIQPTLLAYGPDELLELLTPLLGWFVTALLLTCRNGAFPWLSSKAAFISYTRTIEERSAAEKMDDVVRNSVRQDPSLYYL